MFYSPHFIRFSRALAVLVGLFLASSVFALFQEPTTSAPGNNVFPPVHVGSNAQIKLGNFGANKVITMGKLCFGPTSCINGWWDKAPNTCRLEVKKVNYNTGFFNIGSGGITCNDYLTTDSRDAGWVAVGSAHCATVRHINHTFDSDEAVCGLPSTCVYMRMQCGGSVIVESSSVSAGTGIERHPVAGFTQ